MSFVLFCEVGQLQKHATLDNNLYYVLYKKNLNASRPSSEHPPVKGNYCCLEKNEKYERI